MAGELTEEDFITSDLGNLEKSLDSFLDYPPVGDTTPPPTVDGDTLFDSGSIRIPMEAFNARTSDTDSADALLERQREIRRMDESPVAVYHREGTVNGFPVRKEHRDLLISNVMDIENMFEMVDRVEVFCKVLRPDQPEVLEEYKQIQQMLTDRGARCIMEQEQYDPTQGGFVKLMVYSIVEMVLKKQFHSSYLNNATALDVVETESKAR